MTSVAIYVFIGNEEKLVRGRTRGSLASETDGTVLMTNRESERLSPLAMPWEMWMMVLSFQANANTKKRKRKRKTFMFETRESMNS